MGNAQRCRHSPLARFLQMKPSTLPYRERQNILLKKFRQDCAETVSKKQSKNVHHETIYQTQKINSSPQKKSSSLIPKRNIINEYSNSAPKTITKENNQWYIFTDRRRRYSKENNTFKISPKSYYALDHKKAKKESPKKKSPFLQLQQLIMEDANKPAPIAISPEKYTDQPPHSESEPPGSFSPSFITQNEFTKIDDNTINKSPKANQTSSLQQASNATNYVTRKIESTNVGMYTSITDQLPPASLSKNPSIKSQDMSSNSMKVKSVAKQTVSFRYKLQVEQKSCNIPLMVKQVVALVRQVDPSMNILPFSSEDANDFLDHEDSLPTDEKEIKKWVTNIKIVRDKLHLTMKYSLIKTIPALSGPIFSWMKRNSSYVKMDLIDSAQVTCLGFFEGLHPDFRNRETFRSFCLQHIKTHNPTLHTNISIFPRSVYVGRGPEKIESRAVVIEVDTDQAAIITQALSQEFENEYNNVTFIPFSKIDDSYNMVLKQALIQQNKMLHTYKRKIVQGLHDVQKTITMKDGKQLSIKNWLKSASDDKKPSVNLVLDVDSLPNKSSVIIYSDENEQSLQSLFQNLDSELKKYFPPSELEKVYDVNQSPTKGTTSRILTQSEKSWAEIIKRKYLSNPQSDDDDATTPPNKNRRVLYYGSVTCPNKLQENSFDTNTSSQHTMITEANVTNKIEEKFSTIESLISENVQNALKSVETKLNTKIELNQKSNEKRLNDLEVKNNATFGQLNQSLGVLSLKFDKILNKLFPDEEVESTAAPMDIGEGGKKE